MATRLACIYYNNHFTQLTYFEAVQKQLDAWGLPPESIDVVEYPMEVSPPFNVNEDLELFHLIKQSIPMDPPITFLTVFNEFKKTTLGKKFLEAIAFNNKILKENNIPLVPIELKETDITEPVYYTIGKKLTPVPYMKKGKIVRDFIGGKSL